MTFIVENSVFWRRIVLGLFIISMLGPWGFDLLSVPAQFPCSKPSVRLVGDFCGYPMSGFGALFWVSGFFFHLLAELNNGNIAARIPELVALISMWITILPFFSVLLLIRNRDSHRLQTINLIAWGLAGLSTSRVFFLQAGREQVLPYLFLLWGIWLYILLAIGVVAFEILVLRSNTKSKRKTFRTTLP